MPATAAEKPQTNAVADSLTELERAAQEAAEAAQRADAARAKAEAARLAAEQRQHAAQEQWAREEVAGHTTARQEHNAIIAAAREQFEAAVIEHPETATRAFITWVEALAKRHAADESYGLAQSILGRSAKPPEWPLLVYAEQVNDILGRHAARILDTAIVAEKERRRAAFHGEGKAS